MKEDDPKGRPSKGHGNECTKDTPLLLWPLRQDAAKKESHCTTKEPSDRLKEADRRDTPYTVYAYHGRLTIDDVASVVSCDVVTAHRILLSPTSHSIHEKGVRAGPLFRVPLTFCCLQFVRPSHSRQFLFFCQSPHPTTTTTTCCCHSYIYIYIYSITPRVCPHMNHGYSWFTSGVKVLSLHTRVTATSTRRNRHYDDDSDNERSTAARLPRKHLYGFSESSRGH